MLFDMEPDILVLSGTVLVRELVPGVVAFAVVGVAVLRRPTATAVGWTMLGDGAVLGTGGAQHGAVVGLLRGRLGHRGPAVGRVQHLSNVGWVLGMIVLPQVFPTGWLSGWFWHLLFIVPLVGYATFLVVGGTVEWEFYFPGGSGADRAGDLWAFGSVLGYVTSAIVLIVLVERVRRGPHLVRQQVAPLAVVWLTANGFDLFRSAGAQREPVQSGLHRRLALAGGRRSGHRGHVTQVGLWDSRVVVRRFVVYAVVVGALTLIFAGVYFAMLLALSSRRSTIATAGSRCWSPPARCSPPIRCDAGSAPVSSGACWGNAVNRCGRWLGWTRSPRRARPTTTEVYRTITEIVAEAVRAPGVSLALHQASEIEVVARTGDEPNDLVVLPLLHRGERLGELRVARGRPASRTVARTERCSTSWPARRPRWSTANVATPTSRPCAARRSRPWSSSGCLSDVTCTTDWPRCWPAPG